MSKMSDELRLEIPQPDAQAACTQAIEALGWKTGDADSDRIVAKTGWGVFNNPGSIELLLVSAGDGATAVQMNGSIAQIGPIAKKKLSKNMQELRGAIEAATAG